MEVERVDCGIEIVDCELDDISSVDDERVNSTIDQGIRVGVSGAKGCEQGRDFLGHVCDVVEVSSSCVLVKVGEEDQEIHRGIP